MNSTSYRSKNRVNSPKKLTEDHPWASANWNEGRKSPTDKNRGRVKTIDVERSIHQEMEPTNRSVSPLKDGVSRALRKLLFGINKQTAAKSEKSTEGLSQKPRTITAEEAARIYELKNYSYFRPQDLKISHSPSPPKPKSQVSN